MGKPSVTALYNSLVFQLFFDFKNPTLFSNQNKDSDEIQIVISQFSQTRFRFTIAIGAVDLY